MNFKNKKVSTIIKIRLMNFKYLRDGTLWVNLAIFNLKLGH